MPIISIIVPVYKVENYIHRCIDSILAQTFSDFELILVDDGSPDNSGKICDEYAEKDSRIKVIHQQNAGQSVARNVALDWMYENSNSEYIAFIDSDDWIHPQYLEILYKGVSENGVDISYCKYDVVSDFVKSELMEFPKYTVESSETVWVRDCPNAPWGKIYKANLFKNVRFPVGKVCEDAFIAPIVFFKADRIAVFDEKLYYYFLNQNGTMKSKWSLKMLDEYKAYYAQLQFFKEHGYIEAKKMTEMFYFERLHFALYHLKTLYPNKKEIIKATENDLKKALKEYLSEYSIKNKEGRAALRKLFCLFTKLFRKTVIKKFKMLEYRIKNFQRGNKY